MDYAAFLDVLDKVSLFDLWRLNRAIARAMEDPHKNEAIRAKLCAGQTIRYFDARENREISACIVAVKRSRVLVRNEHDQKLWNIPFYMINLQGTDVDLHFPRIHQKVHRDSLRVGDSVGYKSRDHHEVYGVVVKLNRKTATVRLTDGEQWRVSYGLLFYVLDAQTGTIEGMLDHQVTTGEPATEECPHAIETDSAPE
ncbi:MAG: hypothetical protein ABIK45_13270 [Pseudomonadota bacterium]